MQLFYCPDIIGDLYTLPVEEAKHCVRVLRKRSGDNIDIIDGKGGLYHTTIMEDLPNRCIVEVNSVEYGIGAIPYELHLAFAPTKNIDRVEWLLEKATEIGVTSFTMILSEHSERKVVKIERLEKVVISAVKQSIKSYCPILNNLVSFKEFIKGDYGDMPKFIAHCNDGYDKVHLKHLVHGKALLLIGPEGDFSVEEVELAHKNGFTSVSLGDSRLRTETAGVYATSIVSLME